MLVLWWGWKGQSWDWFCMRLDTSECMRPWLAVLMSGPDCPFSSQRAQSSIHVAYHKSFWSTSCPKAGWIFCRKEIYVTIKWQSTQWILWDTECHIIGILLITIVGLFCSLLKATNTERKFCIMVWKMFTGGYQAKIRFDLPTDIF